MADDSTTRGNERPYDLLTPAQAAEWFGVTVNTIRNWRLAGILQPARSLPNGQHRYLRSTLIELNARFADLPPEDSPPAE